MGKRTAITIFSLLCIGLFAAGFLLLRHLPDSEATRYVSEKVEVISISKDSYEITDDGTVLIYCTYRLRNNSDTAIDVTVGGFFRNEKRASFLEEELLIADEVYSLEPGVDTWIDVVFSGQNGANHTMPDRLQPDPYVVECETNTT